MKTKLTIIIQVIVITILVMGLTVIPSLSTGANGLTAGGVFMVTVNHIQVITKFAHQD